MDNSESRRSTANIDLNESLINDPELPTPEITPNSSQESQESQQKEQEPPVNNEGNQRLVYTLRPFFCAKREFEDFRDFALSLTVLDSLYLGIQTFSSLIGWLLTSSMELSFISLTNFLFFGVIFLLFAGIIVGEFYPTYSFSSPYKLILLRILLVYFWFGLQILAVGASFYTFVWASPGGWGGRGQGTGRGDAQFRGVSDFWRFFYMILSVFGLFFVLSLFQGNIGILLLVKRRRVRERREHGRRIGNLRNYIEMVQ